MRVVRLLHRGFGREEAFEHILHPYLVKEYRNRWYIIGWLESVEAIRTFGLDRIEEMSVVDDAEFRENSDFDAEDFFKYVYGISEPDGKPVEVHLRFTPHQANYVLSKPLHHTHKVVKDTKSGLVVSYNVVPNYEFLQQILHFGDQVKVLKPKAMVDKVKNMVKEMVRLYR